MKLSRAIELCQAPLDKNLSHIIQVNRHAVKHLLDEYKKTEEQRSKLQILCNNLETSAEAARIEFLQKLEEKRKEKEEQISQLKKKHAEEIELARMEEQARSYVAARAIEPQAALAS